MIGIILWLIVIFIIACCTCPGFLTFLFCVALPFGILFYIFILWIKGEL